MRLSLVIPLYNEEESVKQLHREICEVADANNYDLEMIFVDDGSTDGSWSVLEKLSVTDPRVRCIQFRRNFGKAAALQAGFNAAQGELILTLDADLQDDPKEIPDFLHQVESGFDVVSGWKQHRHDPWHKVFPSRVFNGMVSLMTGIKLHDHNCGMKCYRREVLNEIALYGEQHRFLPVLAAARGYKVSEKVIVHRPRQFGHSKYGFARFVKGFLDLLTVWFLTKYGQRPQHLLGTIGLFLIAWSALNCVLQIALSAYIAYSLPQFTGSSPFMPSVRWLIFFSSALSYNGMMPFFCGITFIVLGLLAELFVAKNVQPDKYYSVKKKL